jgi:hypothetical protein
MSMQQPLRGSDSSMLGAGRPVVGWSSRAVLLFLALILAPASLSPVAAAQAVSRDDPRFGAVQSINAPERAVQAGMRWERIIFPWAEMQPNSPDQLLTGYHTDAQIDSQVRRGFTVVGVVLYTPGWAASDPSRGGAAVPRGLDRPVSDPDNYWANFLGKLAARHRGRVDTWIIWNEPDAIDVETKQAYTWAGTEADFWLLQKSAYLAIKRANPDATVLLPGFSYWHAKEAGLATYLERLLDVGASDSSAPGNNWYFDGVSLHVYGNPLNSFALPTLFERILSNRGLRKPMWIVESNAVPWDDPIGLLPREPWRVTMREQASYIIEAVALALAADVERIGVYKMRDEFAEYGQHFGLVREDGSTRPGYGALQTAVSYFTGAQTATYTWNGSANPPSPAEITSLISSNQNRYQFVWPGQVNQVVVERPGQRVTVVWNVSRRPVVGLVSAATDEAVLVDAYGQVSEVTPQDGFYQVYLDAARTNTEPRDSSLTMVGGRPWLIVEQASGGGQPPGVADGLSFSESGYSVANGRFAEYFQRRGGKNTFGYPISREFDLLGAPTQIFQRQVMQLGPDGNVQTLNLLDPDLMPYTAINNSVFPGTDESLKAAAPNPGDPAYAERIVRFVRDHAPDVWDSQPVNFGQTVFNTVTCADAFPEGGCQEALVLLMNVEIWGAPISAPAADPNNAGFIYQRFQRGILHYDSTCGCTQGLLLGEYFKSLVTGRDLPSDLDEQAGGSPYHRQYDQGRVQGVSRPGGLPRSNFKDAFEPLP